MDKIKVNPFHTTDVKELAIDGTTVTSTVAELNIMDGVTLTHDQINNSKYFALGNEAGAAAIGVIDFDSGNDTLYGFYTVEKITPTHVEHVVTEQHWCDNTAGIVSIMGDAATYATVEAVDAAAAHSHISGSVTTATYIPAGTMVYAKVTTATTDSASEAGEGYFLVFYN